MLKLSVDDFRAHARTLSSPDELSVYIARQLMRQVSPSLLWITMHDIDIAHAGAYSLYIEGIRRTDRLCAELWQAIQTEPEYAGNTTLFILPDFGRDSDDDSGGNGFQHHRTGDAHLPHNLDDGSGRGRAPGRGVSIAPWSQPIWCRRSGRCWIFPPRWRKASRYRNCCSVMLPSDLKPEQFNGYPPEAQKADHGVRWAFATAAAELSSRACCARSSTTISSSLLSARPSKRNLRI